MILLWGLIIHTILIKPYESRNWYYDPIYKYNQFEEKGNP